MLERDGDETIDHLRELVDLCGKSELPRTLILYAVTPAFTQHVLPRVPELPSLPAFEWSWAVANPTITAIIATLILLAGIITARRLHIAGKAFAARVRQGFTILRTPRRYAIAVAVPQLAGWACRVGAAAFFLEAFGIPGTLRNALLVMVVGSSGCGSGWAARPPTASCSRSRSARRPR